MNAKNTLKLLILAAIWGSSFIFTRVLSPIIGPALTASMRTLLAGLFLLVVYRFIHFRINWKRDWGHILLIGIINSAVPFFLFAFAALHIPASLSSIMNSTSPMFGALLSALFLIEPLSKRKVLGLVFGTTGVFIISSYEGDAMDLQYTISIGACILAAFCYGISSIYIKLKANHIEPKAIAAGSQVVAGLALLPFAFITPVPFELTLRLVLMILVFAIICSGFAYLLYYDLLRDIGPTRALTVTYLIPVFSIFWGYLLLDESLGITSFAGGSITLLGTYLVTSAKHPKKIQAEYTD